MQLIQGIRNSSFFLRNSLKFLKKNPQIIILPVLNVVILVIILFSFIRISIYYQASKTTFIIGLVFIYFVLAFVAVFFNALLMSCAAARLQGKKLPIFTAIKATLMKTGTLLCWTILSATVSVIFIPFERLSHAIARIIAHIFGFSWTITTCFVLPIIVMENVSAITAFKRAIQWVGKGWRNIVSMNLIVFLTLMALSGLAYLLASLFLHSQYTLNLTINIPLTLSLVICWLISIKSFNAIYNTVLYLNRTGQKQDYFEESILNKVIIKEQSEELKQIKKQKNKLID